MKPGSSSIHFGEFLSAAAIQNLCLTRACLVPGVGSRGTRRIAARFFPVELGEMMWQKKHPVKRGLRQEAVAAGWPKCPPHAIRKQGDNLSRAKLAAGGKGNGRARLRSVAGELDSA